MKKLETPPSEALYPVPVVLISCIDKNSGKANIITIAWCGIICSNPPLVSISIRPSRHSHKLIKETGDFVINIPTAQMVRKVDLCGIRSGKDIDKFRACSFSALPSSLVSSPMIKECPVNIECKLKSITSLGVHDMFIGEVVSVHTDENVIGENGDVDYSKAMPLVFNQGEYWDLGKRIGSYGFSSE
jgi:flavin reductase (DIM6/NTAB) family NADH-FMN oxidoreductase RutF